MTAVGFGSLACGLAPTSLLLVLGRVLQGIGAAGFAPLVYISLFLLRVAVSGPIVAGLQIVPFALASLVVSLLAARVARALGLVLSRRRAAPPCRDRAGSRAQPVTGVR